jgi:sigma-B regulation protein RsbU (phosphoserine phosphatase)
MTDPTPQPTPLAQGQSASLITAAVRLVDLIDLPTLQAIQDGFAQLSGTATSIRDAEGHRVTEPSCANRFCEILGGPLHDNEACRMSNYAAAAAAAAEGRDTPVKYVCHAGLTQYAATIHLEDRVLGTIVLGDVIEEPLSRGRLADLARTFHVREADLARAAAELPPASEERMRSAIGFLQLLANTLTRMCYQQELLREHINELKFLSDTSRLLSSTRDPDAVLETVVRTLAEVMQVKACSLRLLTPTGGELVIKATCGLSPSYLKKGPVLVAENPNDQRALAGEIIMVDDMRTDPLVRYSDEARQEGLVSSLAVGLIAKGSPMGMLHVYTSEPHTFTPEEVRLFRSVADQAAFAIANARLLEEVVTARQHERELALAAKVQQRLLPASAPTVPGYDCAGITVPSAAVGGDFHDWIELPGGNWGIAVGDVAGKGVPGAILMASVRAALRAQAEHIYELDHIMSRVNIGLVAETEVSEFVTLFYGVLDSGARRLTCSSAGHEPAILVRGTTVRKLTAGGPLLGVTADAKYASEVIELQSDDTLVVFTDGAIDAANYQGERFGRERLMDSIRRHAHFGAQRALEEIHWDIRRFTGLAPRADDLTLLVVKVL